MATPFLAQISTYAFNFAPKGWAQCNGQLMPINQNQALFSLLGTTYGGNGQTTFALPDLRGRAPMHPGAGHILGEALGQESHTLIQTQMPLHNHGGSVSGTLQASTLAGSSNSPGGQFPAVTARPAYADSANATMAAPVVANVGGSQPHPNMQPYLCVNYCIALQGIFPSRN